jgi:hypothetical protein
MLSTLSKGRFDADSTSTLPVSARREHRRAAAWGVRGGRRERIRGSATRALSKVTYDYDFAHREMPAHGA